MREIRLCISGIGGRMGRIVAELAQKDPEIISVVGIEAEVPQESKELFSACSIRQALVRADVLLGFANDPEAATTQSVFAMAHKIPVVLATTGLSPEQLSSLRQASQQAPIIQADNFSLGITIFARQLGQIAASLPGSYHVEIVEEHHFRKLDAPSGTALMLARVICQARGFDPAKAIQCGRSGRSDGVRPNGIIGIQAVRGGSIAGIHEVIFAGENETLRFRHEAKGPEVFAQGALTAVKWIIGKAPGWYTMAQVLGLE